MKHRLLSRALRPSAGRWPLAAITAGLGCGLAGMMLAAQLYDDFSNALRRAGADAAVVVISKAVRLGDTLTFTSPRFTAGELAGLRAQPCVRRIGRVNGNTFRMVTEPRGPLQLHTELFVESAPAAFLETRPSPWSWRPGDATVPVIFAAEFLRLYNLVYGPSQGLPPISREALMLLKIPVRIGAGNRSEVVNARIVGFTERLPSIIVPPSFLAWANDRYGSGTPAASTRVLAEVTDVSLPEFASLLEARGYETNAAGIRLGRIGAAARRGALVLGALALLMAVLAFLAAALNTRVLMAAAAADIVLLLDLGYARRELGRWFLQQYLGVALAATLLAAPLAVIGLQRVRLLLAHAGLLTESGSAAAWMAAFLCLATGALVQCGAVWGGLRAANRRYPR